MYSETKAIETAPQRESKQAEIMRCFNNLSHEIGRLEALAAEIHGSDKGKPEDAKLTEVFPPLATFLATLPDGISVIVSRVANATEKIREGIF
jgi:hypothetical protein